MRLLLTLFAASALAGCTSEAAAPMPTASAEMEAAPTPSDADPTVVELYQSQGCSSCPPAITNVNALANRPDVLPLMFAVTYWDRLGWTDRFGDEAHTSRQWDYARHAGRPRVFTPQVVVNGGPILVGDVPAELDRAVRDAPTLTGGPTIDGGGGVVVVGPGTTAEPLTVWLVRYDPRVQRVAIGAGENSGRTLAHRNIVRQLVDLGRWTGDELRVTAPPAADPAYRTAVLLQEVDGGPLRAARRL